MRALSSGRPALLGLACAVAACNGPRAPGPELVLTGGLVFTADSAHPWAQAIAVTGDRILAVGSDSAINALAGTITQRIALEGRLVVPGFNVADARIGAGIGGVEFRTGDRGDPVKAALDAIRAAAKKAPAGVWLSTTVGGAVLDDPRTRRAALDLVSGNHPVMLRSTSGHDALLNSAALHATGLDTLADPAGGWQERDAAGKPTGRVGEYALYGALRALAAARGVTPTLAAFRAYDRLTASLGITSTQNVTTTLVPSLVADLEHMGTLRSRQRLIPLEMTGVGRRDSLWAQVKPTMGLTTISGALWVLDGTPEDRSAFTRLPYAGKAASHGRLNFPPDTIAVLLREALARNEQPVLQVAGDSAIALVFAAMRAVAPVATWQRMRLRLEHADMLTSDLFPAARELGVVVVQRPSLPPLPAFAAQRGSARAAQPSGLQAIVQAGIPLALGADGESNPFVTIMRAVSDPAGRKQALTREQAVLAYTYGSAYAEHAESDKGRLRVGMLADLAVLSQNIFTVPLEALPGTVSVLTMVGGRITQEALKRQPPLKLKRRFWHTPNFIRRLSRNG